MIHSTLVWTLAPLLFLVGCGDRVPPQERSVLRVCADPNNMPFSNERGEGFENRIAELLARELGAELRYVWKPQRRGFVRTGLNANACDVVIGMLRDIEMAQTTRAYYRSAYVFVHPHGMSAAPRSLDDPALAALRIGVQVIGDDYTNTPPVHALARRGLARNLVGYSVYGDYSQEAPPADVIRATARGEVDVSIAWGPLAGYFARGSTPALEVTPIDEPADGELPMQFEIAVAVKRGRTQLLGKLDAILAAHQPAIDAILEEYGVPRV